MSPTATATRAESRTVRLAVAVAALWVVDDAFWHREPAPPQATIS